MTLKKLKWPIYHMFVEPRFSYGLSRVMAVNELLQGK